MSKVPNTISDKEMQKLKIRAAKVAPPSLSTEATKRRIATGKQKFKAELS